MTPSAWALKAELHLWAGGSNAARKAARHALAVCPQQPLAQLVVAILHFRRGELAERMVHFKPVANALPYPWDDGVGSIHNMVLEESHSIRNGPARRCSQ